MSSTAAACGVAVAVGALGWLARPLVLATVPARSPDQRGRHGVRRSLGVGFAWPTRVPSGDVVGEVVRVRMALAAGRSLLGAFTELARAGGPWSAPAAHLVRQVRAGVAMHEALDAWACADEEPALVADALAIAGATGGSQVAALDAVAATLRDRRSLQREIRALSAQAWASALVVVAAPLGFAVLVALLDARVRAFYVSTLAGPACLVGGVLLDAVGAWWMATLIRRVR